MKRFLQWFGLLYILMIPLFGIFWPRTILRLIRGDDLNFGLGRIAEITEFPDTDELWDLDPEKIGRARAVMAGIGWSLSDEIANLMASDEAIMKLMDEETP